MNCRPELPATESNRCDDHKAMVLSELKTKAKRIRRMVFETIGKAGAGHTGGSLSWVEIGTVLYFHVLRIDPSNPEWPERDRFILSKGHSSPTLYCCLAERGYFPREKLDEFDRVNGMLQGHPCMRKTPGVDMSTGSLGQGLSAGVGMALGGEARGLDFHVYVVLGCGEIQEGQVWEAAMFAGFHKIDRLTAIVDYNKVQLTGRINDTLGVEPLRAKWEAFGWKVLEADGHDVRELVEALEKARQIKGKPALVIAHTVKGKGVSFAEGQAEWHGRAPNKAELEQGLKELAD